MCTYESMARDQGGYESMGPEPMGPENYCPGPLYLNHTVPRPRLFFCMDLVLSYIIIKVIHNSYFFI